VHVAIVGGTGFIGRHVACQLVEAGRRVTTIERGTTSSAVPGVHSVRADRNDPVALARALDIVAPRIVIDMIAYRREDIERLLAALPHSVERLVVISSGDVYASYGVFLGLSSGPPVARASDEQAPLRTELFPYRRRAQGPNDMLFFYEKILVERAATAWSRGATTVLRLPMVYGPDDKQRRVAKYIERFRTSAGTIRINAAEAAWHCTRGYVGDVAAAIKLATLSDAADGKVFNLGEPVALSELAWARAIATAAGWRGEVVADADAPPALPANWSAGLTIDTAQIRQVLGYDEPVGRDEGLRRTVTSITSGSGI
jgi:nucleoside-diphosphate-sugar epimerase